MSEIPTSEPRVLQVPVGPPTAILAWSHSGEYFLSRQSQAIADYWLALADAHRPKDAVSAGLGFWGELWGGFAAALAEAAAPLGTVSRAAVETPPPEA